MLIIVTVMLTLGVAAGFSTGKDRSLQTQQILEKVAVDQTLSVTSRPGISATGPFMGNITFTAKDIKRFTPDPIEIKLKDIERPQQIKLSLQDCVAKSLANNFKIKTEGYGPAISATDILKAEAAFDAVYFLESQFNKTDHPTIVRSQKDESDQRTLSSGIRKYLPTGAVLAASYNLVRLNNTTLEKANYDPTYTNNFMVELRQPLLKGFGLDYNRASIEYNKNQTKIAKYRFRRTVRDTLADVEKSYWQLIQARRDVVIQQTLVKQTEETLDTLEKRALYDVYGVQPTRVKALLGTRRAEYVQIKNTVKDVEDQLKSLMNDPDLNLGEDIEIIPSDYPTVGPVVVDRISEVQSALKCRSELEEAKLNIENFRINVAVMKNNSLPKFDLTFRYTINGMSDNPGNAFDEMTTSNFQDYFVGVSFEYPIGNRGPRAELKKAILQRDQAIAGLKQVIEGVILDVDVAVRNLQTSYHQVTPSKESVVAAEENLAAIIARKIKLSPEFLEVQLNAQETMANSRRVLLRALVNYNISIVQLERAKDTLLRYDNVEMQAE
jgi:outer membrane protein TolC